MTSPLSLYQDCLKKPDFRRDAQQEQAVKHLHRIYTELLASHSNQHDHWFFRHTHRATPKGLYLWGGVGRGKTFLMDLFYQSLPFSEKMRLHFYRFMERIHAELALLSGEKDPLKSVAKKLAAETRIICLDEFMVEDIADAMILALLLQALFAEGVCLVATSNITPNDLYLEGLQRAKFLPAIELLKTNTEVLNVDAGVDYRQESLEIKQRFYTPLLGEREFMQSHFDLLTHGQSLLNTNFKINDRDWAAISRADKVVWLEFAELCKAPRGAADYIALANQYQQVLISNMPSLSDNMDDYARRFVSLIDEFYDHNVNIILSANVSIPGLYTGARLKAIFERTLSRLEEMLA